MGENHWCGGRRVVCGCGPRPYLFLLGRISCVCSLVPEATPDHFLIVFSLQRLNYWFGMVWYKLDYSS